MGRRCRRGLRERVTEVFGHVLYDLYGSTEAGWVAVATPEDIRDRPGTVGRPVGGVEIAASPSEESPSLPERPGSSTSEARPIEGYLGDDEAHEREGFLALGDLGSLDEDGYLHVEGRQDEMVVVGGENVYPVEVEEVLAAVEDVDDVAVLGVGDGEYGHVLAAFYEGAADPRTVEAAARDALASCKVPRKVERVESLHRTATAKVLKRDLLADGDPVASHESE